MKLALAKRSLAAIERRNLKQAQADAALARQIGAEIRKQRIDRRLKLRHLAQAAGISITRVHEIEVGAGPLMSAELLSRIFLTLEGGREA